MARITEKDVHHAAAELDAQGIKPTTSKIREKLGRGSFSTIQIHLATYEVELVVGDTPKTPEELHELLPIIWEKCFNIAGNIFNKEREKLTAIIKEKESEIETFINIIEELDKKLENNDKNKEELEGLKEKNAYLTGQIDGVQKKPATTRKRARTTRKAKITENKEGVKGEEEKK